MFHLSKNSKNNRQGIDSRLIEISDLAIKISTMDFGHGPYSGLRTSKEQNFLHKQGKSPKCDGFIKCSKHQSGSALDFYAYIDGAASWNRNHLAMVACAFLQSASLLGYKISWGGLWGSSKHKYYGWDMPHIQIED